MPGYPNAPYGQNVNPQMQNMGQGIPAQGVPHQQMPELQPNSYTKNPYEAMAQPAMQPQPQQYAALPEQSPAPQHNEPGPAVPEADIQPITVQRAETEETVEKNTGFDDSESDDSEALMAIFENL